LVQWRLPGIRSRATPRLEDGVSCSANGGHSPLRSLVLLAFFATAAVLVEYYDFFIFAYAASAFPKIFFPDLSPKLALVFSCLIFAAGFPARLLGAFIFGNYGDRVGRKNSFLINLLMVGIGGQSQDRQGFRHNGPPSLHLVEIPSHRPVPTGVSRSEEASRVPRAELL
jgi:hypothetical protein